VRRILGIGGIKQARFIAADWMRTLKSPGQRRVTIAAAKSTGTPALSSGS